MSAVAARRPLRNWEEYDVSGELFRYETENVSVGEEITLFQYLVDSAMVFHLQGNYQRRAQTLIDAKLVSTDLYTAPEESPEDWDD